MISVVVPVYNVEKYLRLCIDSILKQSYRDFEIILVNDGSKDSSGDICNEYSRFDNIRVIHKENEGLGYARNTGIDEAGGDFIVFLDSDDFIEEDTLLDLYNGIKKEDCDTCIGGHNRVNLDNEFVSSHAYENNVFKDEKIIHEFLPRMVGSAPEKKDSVSVSACNVLYSMEIIKQNNLKFVSERDLISEDLIFNLEYFRHSKGVLLIEKCNYNYRINTNSLTTRYNKDRFESIKKIYHFQNNLLKDIKIYDICRYRLMRQFFNYIRMCFNQENIKISNLKYTEALSNLKNICSDDLVRSIVKEYPINKLEAPQKLFVLLIKYRFIRIIYFCIKFGVV